MQKKQTQPNWMKKKKGGFVDPLSRKKSGGSATPEFMKIGLKKRGEFVDPAEQRGSGEGGPTPEWMQKRKGEFVDPALQRSVGGGEGDAPAWAELRGRGGGRSGRKSRRARETHEPGTL